MLQYQPDAELIAATLLHDTLEDTSVLMRDIQEISPEVAELVEWATKIWCVRDEWSMEYLTPEQEKFETIRKILTASQKDIRILFLKIFDRLHNMITIDAKKPESQKRIALETLNIYVPLAKRSGLRDVYHILKWLCIMVLEPEKWSTLETFVSQQAQYMRQESEEVKEYFSWQTWSTKILAYRTKFLSPFSLDPNQHFFQESWYAPQIIVEKPTDCYTILHDIGHRWDINCIQAGVITDFINNPRFSGYSGLHFEIIFRGFKRIKIRIIPENSQDSILSQRTFKELKNIYAPVLFRDFDLINEATISNSEAFMESVTAHIFSRKIPLHSIIKPLFYMPEWLTMLDAVMYLEPEKFIRVENIYRNNEKVPFHAIIHADDIITYTFWNTITITQGSKKDINSGISRWRIEQLRNT